MKSQNDKEHFTEQDPVWEMLEQTSVTEPSETFSRNVVRSVRILEDQKTCFWQKLLTPKPLLALGAVTACLIFALMTIFQSSPTQPDTPVVQHPAPQKKTMPSETSAELIIYLQDDELASDLLVAMAENSDLLNDEDIAQLIGF